MSLRRFVAVGLATASLAVAGNASAAYHYMKIVEVMAGPGSYVNLEMYFAGQTVLGGHTINVYDAADNLLDSVALTAVTKGDANSRILIGTSQTEATFGVKPDFATLKALPPAGGKVCFDPAATSIDCFSWGNYPNKAPTGLPFGVLSITTAAKRKVDGGASAKLDGTEDTDSSVLDFTSGTPAPINNAGMTGAPAGVDAGSTTSSSSSSSASSTGGNPSSSSSSNSASGGVTTNPSSSSSSSSAGAAAPAAAPAEDEGCNTAGDTGGLTAVPLLALVALAVAKRRRRA